MNVYLSHAEADANLARNLSRALREFGVDAWVSGEQVFPGDNWALAAAQALETSSAMIVLLTQAGVRSAQVTREWGYAIVRMNYLDRVIPVRVEPLPIDDIPWVLKQFQVVSVPQDASTPDALRLAARHIANVLLGATAQV